MKVRPAAVVALFIATLACPQQVLPRPPLRVSHVELVYKVDPQYPEEARQKRIRGKVLLSVTIDKDGRVQEVRAVSGKPILADAAMKAIKQWRYQPILLNGEPMEVEATVTIKFHM